MSGSQRARRLSLSSWGLFMSAGLVLMALYVALPAGPGRVAVYFAIGVGAVGAVLCGVWLHGPDARAPWLLFAAGQLAWVVGDTVFNWDHMVRHVSPFPSVGDVAYLLAYPLLAAGIALLIRRGGRSLDVNAVVDSGIVVVALALVSWAWIARPMIEATDVSALERTIAVAYPIGDIILMAMLVRLVATPGTVSTALKLLVGAVLAQIIADTALAAGASDSWQYASGLDLLWLGSYVLWGAAALHPTMGIIARRSSVRGALFSRRRVVMLGAAALLPSVTAAVALALGRSVEAWSFVAGSIVLTSLVLVRMGSAIAEVHHTAGQRDHLEGELYQRALLDPLTGLFNRAYMLRLITSTLGRARPAGIATGLIMIDLDDFKVINKDRGPSLADDILKELARKICVVTGPHRPVARAGGDQFVVLVEHSEHDETTTRLAEELATMLLAPLEVAGRRVTVRARLGVTVSADSSAEAAELLHEALIANRRAKLRPPGEIEVFDSTLRHEAAERDALESALRAAIRDDQLELHYQPVMAVGVAAIDGYEALVRWRRGADQLVMPDAFIPIAERSDLICDLGRWVLCEATRQLASWLAIDAERFGHQTVAVNVSGRHLADRCIVDDVAAALRASGLAGHHLVIEVTETVLIDEPNAMLQLAALRELGVSVSLDDFGTGYASIGRLRHLPVDTIKIDKSFLASTEPGSAELVALMTAAAHACGMLVVAEGVERADQLDRLKGMHCDFAQGYFFARPMAADAVLQSSQLQHRPDLRLVGDS